VIFQSCQDALLEGMIRMRSTRGAKRRPAPPGFYEFFAGGGMARAGLGPNWNCLFANDFDPKKATAYAANWGAGELRVEDVGRLSPADLPGKATLAWASFPCQDLSLAGSGAGLKGERSGTFWAFWSLMKALDMEGRAPSIIVLENVSGALTSHGGKDFAAIGSALAGTNYLFGALIINAVHFVPQSRPRLFIIAVRKGFPLPSKLMLSSPSQDWHPAGLAAAYRRLPIEAQQNWIWWWLPAPPPLKTSLTDLIEARPQGVKWHTAAETQKLLEMMAPANRAKVDAAKIAGRRIVGTVYKRTRLETGGARMQRAEVRFDGIAGCLRTPSGGSSRQTVMIVEAGKVASRLLSPREAARLMGLPDTYQLPVNYNEAYHLAGDGVAVPVVTHIAENILDRLIAARAAPEIRAAQK
jgi:DNA (cytosine-5)-methyltransferase 1